MCRSFQNSSTNFGRAILAEAVVSSKRGRRDLECKCTSVVASASLTPFKRSKNKEMGNFLSKRVKLVLSVAVTNRKKPNNTFLAYPFVKPSTKARHQRLIENPRKFALKHCLKPVNSVKSRQQLTKSSCFYFVQRDIPR